MAFTPLKDIQVKISGTTPKVPDHFLNSDINTPSFEMTSNAEHHALEQMVNTIDHLQAFSSAVKQYGLTRSLMAFADHDKALSSAIPAIPALESMTGDISVKRSADVVAAVEASIVDAIKIAVLKFKARLKNMLDRMTSKTKRLNETVLHIDTLKKLIAEGRVLDDKLVNKKVFSLLPHDVLMPALNATPTVLQTMKQIAETKLPFTEAEYVEYVKSTQAAFNKLTSFTELKMDDHGQIKIVQEEAPIKKGTLKELGYTKLEEFDTIHDKIMTIVNCLDEVVALLENFPENFATSKDAGPLKYSRSAALIGVVSIETLYYCMVWHADPAAANVLKALFACSEKK